MPDRYQHILSGHDHFLPRLFEWECHPGGTVVMYLNSRQIWRKEWKTQTFKAGPLEAILVIFGRRALTFFLFESSWKKMKNDATFVRMRSCDYLGDAKMSKKGTSLRRIQLFY